MSVGSDQRKFSLMLASLIVWIYREGYEVTFGDVWAKTGHKDGSFHYKRLAADLNLFKDGVYLTEAEDHLFIGEEWERMGGSWGGRFGDKGEIGSDDYELGVDSNHYSYGE